MATKAVVSEQDAIKLAEETYGLRNVTRVKTLPSYDDVNYRLETGDGKKYLLKVFHAAMSANRVRLEEQLGYQCFLGENGILVPGIIKDSQGKLQSYQHFALGNGERGECAVRMLEYVDGVICQQLPLFAGFFVQIGENCGDMHNLMSKSSDRFPGLNSLVHDWSLQSLVIKPDSRANSSAIDNQKTRDIVGRVLDEFSQYVAKTAPNLPSGVVHCDLNSLNIIGEETGDGGVTLRAIIDFGDVCHSPFMFDLAICLIYMMVAAKVQNGCMYEVLANVMKGYKSRRTLLPDEQNGLFLAVKARAAQSVIGGYYTAQLEPHNRAYLMSECSVAEAILHEIDGDKFEAACL